jgi:hypothetical protein
VPLAQPHARSSNPCSPQKHYNENSGRRCPRAFQYVAKRCPQRNKKSPNSCENRAACGKGDACGFAHTVYELW